MLKDEDLMPFGQYKGEMMEDVPPSYLLWLLGEMKGKTMSEGSDNQKVYQYIIDNEHFLRDN